MYSKENLLITPKMKVADAILVNPSLVLMLEHFGISLGLQEKTVAELSSENGINTQLFISFAHLFNGTELEVIKEYSHEDIRTILDYLRKCHIYYLNEKCPQIRRRIKNMYELNSPNQITMVETFFNEYVNEITTHISYEDKTVFPYIHSLMEQLSEHPILSKSVEYSVVEYRDHHNDIEEKLNDLKSLLIKYLPVKQDQVVRRKLLNSLFELENDLNIHSQIEDLILIPLVEKMEAQIAQNR